jgi:hypothetical protein
MKIILAGGAVLIVVMAVLLFVMEPANAPAPEPEGTPIETVETSTTTEEGEVPSTDESPSTLGKLKADMFTGKLEEVNTGCFADGECYVTVGGKHVTVIMGWSQETVGTIIGAPSIGDLESMIGKEVEVYAQENTDGTYTLYGDTGFYVKVLN